MDHHRISFGNHSLLLSPPIGDPQSEGPRGESLSVWSHALVLLYVLCLSPMLGLAGLIIGWNLFAFGIGTLVLCGIGFQFLLL